MNEIEPVIDVRLASDSLDLIIVRQKFAIEGKDLQPVGVPSESRLSLSPRRVEIKLTFRITTELGRLLIAHVRNLGFTLLDVTEVRLELTYPHTNPAGLSLSDRQTKGRIHFIPTDRQPNAPLVPAQSRDWYLPPDMFDTAADLADNLPPEACRVVVNAGEDEIGCLAGEIVKSMLRFSQTVPSTTMGSRVMRMLETLPADDQRAAQVALQDIQLHKLEETPQVRPVPTDPQAFLVPFTEQLFLLIRRRKPGRLAVLDVLNAETVESLLSNQSHEQLGTKK